MTSPSSILPPAGSFGPLSAGLTAFTFETGKFFAMLNTLASQNRVNIVSNPHILTSENKKAVINVSESIPIVTSQQLPIGGATSTSTTTTTAVVGTQSVEYRDAGVVLTVTPRIGERGTVALDVKQEVNDIGTEKPPTNSLSIIKREAETSVVLINNQTLVLGGLIKDKITIDDRGIPFLKDIPILRFLFGSTSCPVRLRSCLKGPSIKVAQRGADLRQNNGSWPSTNLRKAFVPVPEIVFTRFQPAQASVPGVSWMHRVGPPSS